MTMEIIDQHIEMILSNNSWSDQRNILVNRFRLGITKHMVKGILNFLNCPWFVDHRDEDNACVFGENI